MRSRLCRLAILLPLCAACSTRSSDPQPSALDRALDRAEVKVQCPAPEARLVSCLNGAAPTMGATGPFCPSPVRLRPSTNASDGLTREEVAQLAVDAINWAWKEQNLRLELAARDARVCYAPQAAH